MKKTIASIFAIVVLGATFGTTSVQAGAPLPDKDLLSAQINARLHVQLEEKLYQGLPNEDELDVVADNLKQSIEAKINGSVGDLQIRD